jgi:hypothetical protein
MLATTVTDKYKGMYGQEPQYLGGILMSYLAASVGNFLVYDNIDSKLDEEHKRQDWQFALSGSI